MKKILWLVMAAVFSLGSFAGIESMRKRAGQVAEYKDKGIIAEQADGYLRVVKDEGGAKALVDAENQDRLEEYTKRAKESGQEVSVFARVLGEARLKKEKNR